MSKMKDRLHTGELYFPSDPEIMKEQARRLNRLYDFNMTRPTEGGKEGSYVEGDVC